MIYKIITKFEIMTIIITLGVNAPIYSSLYILAIGQEVPLAWLCGVSDATAFGKY